MAEEKSLGDMDTEQGSTAAAGKAGSQDVMAELEALRAKLKDVSSDRSRKNQEAVELKKKLDDAEKKLQAIMDKEKTELQRAQEAAQKAAAEKADAESKLRALETKLVVTMAGVMPDAVDYVSSMYSTAAAGQDFDATTWFSELKKQKPFLFVDYRPPAPGTSAGGAPPPGSDSNKVVELDKIIDALKRKVTLTAQERALLINAISERRKLTT